MFGRIGRAFKNELIKYGTTKFLYLGLALSAALPLFCSEGFKQLGADRGLNGFNFLANSAQVALTSLIPAFALIFASVLVASETARGTYRDVLSRPIGRAEFLTAKFLTASLYLLALVSVNFIVALMVAKFKYGIGAVVEDNEVIVSSGRFLRALIFAYVLEMFPLLSVTAFGFFISTLSRTLVGAVGFTLGIYLGIEPFKFLIPIGSTHLDRYLFSSYLDVPFGILNDLAGGVEISWSTPKIHWCIGLSLIYTSLFVALSFATFLKRDLNG